MGQYTNKGLYNAYKKNNKEREEKDYYATPTVEVVNILDTLGYDFSNKTILEPCIGGGHMADGILEYIEKSGATNVRLIGRDVQDRGYSDFNWELEYGQDFLSDDYPDEDIDIIIMNPPYSILEPFMIRALEIAKEKVIVLGRTQATEGSGRYEKIYKDNPFTHFYQYVDRIQCWKNGVKPTGSSAQAYGWLIWDKLEKNEKPTFNWIRRK
jgi:hypothetical protein